jgi:hypothetical protein
MRLRLSHIAGGGAVYAAAAFTAYKYFSAHGSSGSGGGVGDAAAAGGAPGGGSFDRLARVYDATVGSEETYMLYGLMRWVHGGMVSTLAPHAVGAGRWPEGGSGVPWGCGRQAGSQEASHAARLHAMYEAILLAGAGRNGIARALKSPPRLPPSSPRPRPRWWLLRGVKVSNVGGTGGRGASLLPRQAMQQRLPAGGSTACGVRSREGVHRRRRPQARPRDAPCGPSFQQQARACARLPQCACQGRAVQVARAVTLAALAPNSPCTASGRRPGDFCRWGAFITHGI